MKNLQEIINYFLPGRTPTYEQFKESWTSFWHKSEKMPMSQVVGLNNALDDKASKEDLANATTKFKGYHTTLAKLEAEYPQAQNKKDFFGWMGSPYPGTVYKVYADGGAWTNTGEVPTQQEIDLAEYLKKAALTNEITDDVDTVPSNHAVNNLQVKLYGSESGGTVEDVTYIPYYDDTNNKLLADVSCSYANQNTYIDKKIGYLRVKMAVAGTFTVYSSTERNNVSKARWKKTFNTVLGENNLVIAENVNQGEFLCFEAKGDTARFAINTTRPNAVGGDLYYGNERYPQDLCIGIYSGYNIEDVDGDIPKLWAKIEEIENGSGSSEVPTTVIAYDGTGNKVSIDLFFGHNIQSSYQGKYINYIEVNGAGNDVVTVGFFADKSVANLVWSKEFNLISGYNRLDIGRTLLSDQYMYVKGKHKYKEGGGISNPVGGTIAGDGLVAGDICIGVTINRGEATQPPPEPVLTEIEKWRKMEMDICKYYAIPCLDITYTNGITAFSMGKLMPDGVHPNTEGHKFLATAIYPIFSGLASIMADGDSYYSLGDSITAGFGDATSYAHYLAVATGLNRTNKAVSGNHIKGDQFYGQISSVPNNFEGIVTVMIGLNDYNQKYTRGDVATILAKPFAELDRNASSGEAFRFGLETLLRKAPNCKILVIVPFFTTW